MIFKMVRGGGTVLPFCINSALKVKKKNIKNENYFNIVELI